MILSNGLERFIVPDLFGHHSRGGSFVCPLSAKQLSEKSVQWLAHPSIRILSDVELRLQRAQNPFEDAKSAQLRIRLPRCGYEEGRSLRPTRA